MEKFTNVNWNDSKINFVIKRCASLDVLDLGCVEHFLEREQNSNWIHRALVEKTKSVLGLDYLEAEVAKLNEQGYDIIFGNAENFALEKKFDAIVAGDLIEHLNNYGNFLECCVKHMHSKSKLLITSANPWHWHKIIRASYGEVPINFEHTCWMTPNCLGQLGERYGLTLLNVEYGSSRIVDSFLPLPKRLRHSSWYAELGLTSSQ